MSEVDPMSGTRLEPFAPAGVSTHPERTLLADRAADYLRAGPANARTLIASVCQLSTLPDVVAEHMALTLLGGHPRFARAVDGTWRLSEPAAAFRPWSTTIQPAASPLAAIGERRHSPIKATAPTIDLLIRCSRAMQPGSRSTFLPRAVT